MKQNKFAYFIGGPEDLTKRSVDRRLEEIKFAERISKRDITTSYFSKDFHATYNEYYYRLVRETDTALIYEYQGREETEIIE